MNPTLPEPEISDDVLRRMNHVEWLNDFSNVIGLQAPGSPPMTPMRQGAIQRLRLAAQYIELLQKELHWAKRKTPPIDLSFDPMTLGEKDDPEPSDH